MRAWVRRIRSMAVVSAVTGAMAFSAANADLMIIQYSFDDNTAEATTNEAAGLGVTAGDIQTSNDHGGNTGIDNERWQRKLLGESPTTMSFTITIPSDVTIDLTDLSFVYGMDSRQGTNDTWGGWDLEVFQDGSEVENSASTDSWGPLLLACPPHYLDWDDTVSLSGLTGLTDTVVEFAFTVNYATGEDFSGGNNNSRHAFLDDVTLTAIPEPGTAGLLAVFAGAALLRRRRRR